MNVNESICRLVTSRCFYSLLTETNLLHVIDDYILLYSLLPPLVRTTRALLLAQIDILSIVADLHVKVLLVV
jgi:hypothetical protein